MSVKNTALAAKLAEARPLAAQEGKPLAPANDELARP